MRERERHHDRDGADGEPLQRRHGVGGLRFHVYGLHRLASSADVYYDGQRVVSYPTDDNGAPQSLLFDLVNGFGQAVYGDGSRVLVDYVRAWQ
jgi:hypothetical protein